MDFSVLMQASSEYLKIGFGVLLTAIFAGIGWLIKLVINIKKEIAEQKGLVSTCRAERTRDVDEQISELSETISAVKENMAKNGQKTDSLKESFEAFKAENKEQLEELRDKIESLEAALNVMSTKIDKKIERLLTQYLKPKPTPASATKPRGK
jgi:uncharacterized coiled-coil DUF342 family protein